MKKLVSRLAFFLSFCLVFSTFGPLSGVAAAGEAPEGTPVSTFEELADLLSSAPGGSYYLTQDLEVEFKELIPEEYEMSQETRAKCLELLQSLRSLCSLVPDPVAILRERKTDIWNDWNRSTPDLDGQLNEKEKKALFEIIFNVFLSFAAGDLTEEETLDACITEYSLFIAKKNKAEIPGFTSIPVFGGVLDGRGHSISGIRISAEALGPGTGDGNTNMGAFIRENSGTIKNLRLEDVRADTEFGKDCGNLFFGALCGVNNGTVRNVTADVRLNVTFSTSIGNGDPSAADPNDGYVGLLVGRNNGTLENCRVSGTAEMNRTGLSLFRFGGITGRNAAGAVLRGCVNEADLTETIRVAIMADGGLLAGVCGVNQGVMEDCVNRGTVQLRFGGTGHYMSTSCYVGGVCHDAWSNGVLRRCVNEGTVTVNNGRVTDGEMRIYVGGVTAGSAGPLEDCVNRGEVSLDSLGFRYLYAGGVAAYLVEGAAVSRCRNEGTVTCIGAQKKNSDQETLTGGIVGYGEDAYVRGCENRGVVTGGCIVGGICGKLYNRNKGELHGCANHGEIRVVSVQGDEFMPVRIGGGIAGRFFGKISSCCNFGAVRVLANDSYDIGGLIGGHILDFSITMENCFNAGTDFSYAWTLDTVNGAMNHLYDTRDVISYCYNADPAHGFVRGMSAEELSGLSKTILDLNVNVTAERLADPATYQGWDFEDVWFFDETGDYPYPLLVAVEYGEVTAVRVNDPAGAGVDFDPALGFLSSPDVTLTISYTTGKTRVVPLTAQRLLKYSDLRAYSHGEQAVTVKSGGVRAENTVAVRVHNAETIGAVQATCEQDGATGKAACAECGLVFWENSVIPALGHDYEVYSSTEPTCSSAGLIRSRCTRCGDRLDETLEKLPHTLGEGAVIQEPSYSSEGRMRYTCSVCGASVYEDIPRLQAKPGDVDGDEKITASDARLALRRAVLLESFDETSRAFLAADVDGDRSVTASDARTILRAAVGLETLD